MLGNHTGLLIYATKIFKLFMVEWDDHCGDEGLGGRGLEANSKESRPIHIL